MNNQFKARVIHQSAPYHPPSRMRAWLIGRPLPTADAEEQAIGKIIALAVFASDALSSTAYATQEILLILSAAGTLAFGLTFPIALAIVILLAIVALSYQQTIHAYPNGGGAYTVARDNLGPLAAQTAGAALLTDYILTVAVSVSAGVAQLVSAYPPILPYRVIVAVGLVMLIMLANLRGVRESGTIFAIPSYFFLAMMVLTILIGFFRLVTGGLPTVIDPPSLEGLVVHPLTAFLVLRAFSSGTSAMTGIEAISNGVTAFKEPRSHNAAVTLAWMAAILSTLFLAITYLALQIKALPSESETVISQLARTVFDGRGILYLGAISATTLILVMAANTAFAGFPRLAALMAGDRYLPRQFTYRGSRLVFTWGIIVLALAASALIFVFQASVSGLIPLYAIGVFLSFTLSQFGMALRWRKVGHLKPGETRQDGSSILSYDTTWRVKMLLNGFGAVCTLIVMMIFAGTKFVDGAWVVLVIIPIGVFVFYAIHRHFEQLAGRLSLENHVTSPKTRIKSIILPISGVHQGTLAALRFAQTFGSPMTAVHVAEDEDSAHAIAAKWEAWGEGTPLIMIDSPFRELMHPLVTYIHAAAEDCAEDEVISVVVPQFVPERPWQNLLHMQTASWLRWALLQEPNIIVVDVPYQVK